MFTKAIKTYIQKLEPFKICFIKFNYNVQFLFFFSGSQIKNKEKQISLFDIYGHEIS